jgi:hypothetical protein
MSKRRLLWLVSGTAGVGAILLLVIWPPPEGLRDDYTFATRADLHAISSGLDTYKGKHGSYPSTEQGLRALVADDMFRDPPKDRWGHDYVYRFPVRAQGDSFDLFSLGPDGVESSDDIHFRQ